MRQPAIPGLLLAKNCLASTLPGCMVTPSRGIHTCTLEAPRALASIAETLPRVARSQDQAQTVLMPTVNISRKSRMEGVSSELQAAHILTSCDGPGQALHVALCSGRTGGPLGPSDLPTMPDACQQLRDGGGVRPQQVLGQLGEIGQHRWKGDLSRAIAGIPAGSRISLGSRTGVAASLGKTPQQSHGKHSCKKQVSLTQPMMHTSPPRYQRFRRACSKVQRLARQTVCDTITGAAVVT